MCFLSATVTVAKPTDGHDRRLTLPAWVVNGLRAVPPGADAGAGLPPVRFHYRLRSDAPPVGVDQTGKFQITIRGGGGSRCQLPLRVPAAFDELDAALSSIEGKLLPNTRRNFSEWG